MSWHNKSSPTIVRGEDAGSRARNILFDAFCVKVSRRRTPFDSIWAGLFTSSLFLSFLAFSSDSTGKGTWRLPFLVRAADLPFIASSSRDPTPARAPSPSFGSDQVDRWCSTGQRCALY